MKNKHPKSNWLRCYYGKPKSPEMTATKAIVLAQQFDQGEPVMLSFRVSAFEEPYSEDFGFAASFRNDEHHAEVLPKRNFVTDLDEDDYIESFEVKKPEVTEHPNEKPPCGCKDSKPHLEKRSLDKKNNEEKPSISKSLTDDDLMADIQSILSGQKFYDESNKQVVGTPPANNSRPVQPAAETRPIDQKDEHQIFDKLAQSMRYANAYDLGAISMQTRFADFDRQEDQVTAKTINEDPYAVNYYQEKAGMENLPLVYEKADMTDFVEDMDVISYMKTTSVDWGAIRAKIAETGLAEHKAWCKETNTDCSCKKQYKEEDSQVESLILGYWNRTKDDLMTTTLADLKSDRGRKNCDDTGDRFDALKEKLSSKEFSDLTDPEKTELFKFALCHNPWSAVFVCYVIKKALKTFGQDHLFKTRWAHNKYLMDAIANRTNNKPIQAFKIDLADIQIGDIIIKNRDSRTIKDEWHQIIDDKVVFDTTKIDGWFTHGDIVIEVDTTAHKIKVLGGNTKDQGTATSADTVGISELSLNENNRLTYNGAKGGHFAIIKMQQ